MSIAVVDDDPLRRIALAEKIDADPRVQVVHAIDQDTAATWTVMEWRGVAAAVVDAFDDRAPGERGTDLYSGINAIECLRMAAVRVVAILPCTPHPAVQLRLWQSRPDVVLFRWELPTVDDLIHAILGARPGRNVPQPSHYDLAPHGMNLRSDAQGAVRIYVESPLHGLLCEGITQRALGIGRRAIDRFSRQVVRTGLVASVGDPGWLEARDYVLKLLGRLQSPHSQFDQPWLTQQ